MVDAVVFAVLGIVVQTAHYQMVRDGLNILVHGGQADIALEVVGEHVDFDVHQVGRAFTALQSDGQLVVHVLVREHLKVNLQSRLIGIGVPFVQHGLVKFGMQFLEGPQGQFDGFLGDRG